MAFKALESKNPKFMKTIEEITPNQGSKKQSAAFPYMQVDLKSQSRSKSKSKGLQQYKSPTYQSGKIKFASKH
jgi:hypothetical protein